MKITFERASKVLLLQHLLILGINETVQLNVNHLILFESELDLNLLVECYFVSILASFGHTID